MQHASKLNVGQVGGANSGKALKLKTAAAPTLNFLFQSVVWFKFASEMSVTDIVLTLAQQAKTASRFLARLTTGQKNACLEAMAAALEARKEEITRANAMDMQAGSQSGLSAAMLDRLRLDEKRIASMAKGLREVAALPDPVGRILDERTRPNDLKLQKIATPIGVVVIIYESRPNVTADAASLCFKSGNATILRGGKEALNSNQVIAQVMVEAGRNVLPDFPEHAIQLVPIADREAIPELLSLTQYIDLCMPRGGEGLIRAVAACSKVPVIKHYKGVCHVYVDDQADLEMAEKIVMNAKVQRPAVCNAMETLLVHQAVASEFLQKIAPKLGEYRVSFRADTLSQAHLGIDGGLVQPAREEDWSTEYNDFILNVKVVDSVSAAISHINQYGSNHSDSIVTKNQEAAKTFLADVDSAAVYWNASTRFTDGGEFGMGAEIGISTDKIGARGPMGLEELTTYKWLGFGTGQVRG
ncbi:MAG: glutamate-5-semialdehyde dehydrogenase [Verrucomicrobiales bacterium]